MRAFDEWQAVAKQKAGPLFRRISTADRIGDMALHLDVVRRILGHRAGLAGLELESFERLSAHALRVGFITEAYAQGPHAVGHRAGAPASLAARQRQDTAQTAWATADGGRRDGIWGGALARLAV